MNGEGHEGAVGRAAWRNRIGTQARSIWFRASRWPGAAGTSVWLRDEDSRQHSKIFAVNLPRSSKQVGCLPLGSAWGRRRRRNFCVRAKALDSEEDVAVQDGQEGNRRGQKRTFSFTGGYLYLGV